MHIDNAQQDFAAAWISLWVRLGGTIQAASTFYGGAVPYQTDDVTGDEIVLGRPETNFAARLKGVPKLDVDPSLELVDAAGWDGAMRLMQIFARAVPGGLDAIRALVIGDIDQAEVDHGE